MTENKLQLSPIILDPEYMKKWNVRMSDFVVLTINGVRINYNIYRVGGIKTPNLVKDNYIMLLKYVEAYYSDEILKMSHSKDSKHLDGRWCIIDKNGIEKVEFESFKNPYLVEDSCIYSIGSDYYNIETGEHYAYSSKSMVSTDFLFLNRNLDSDKSKRGVLKICKKTGQFELFPSF